MKIAYHIALAPGASKVNFINNTSNLARFQAFVRTQIQKFIIETFCTLILSAPCTLKAR